MLEHARSRCQQLQSQIAEQNISVALFGEESSIAYLAGFCGYLGIEFDRPTMRVVYADKAAVVITPLMESEMIGACNDKGKKHHHLARHRTQQLGCCAGRRTAC